jgi:uncharacterized protein YbjQ (UPF0145 family)
MTMGAYTAVRVGDLEIAMVLANEFRFASGRVSLTAAQLQAVFCAAQLDTAERERIDAALETAGLHAEPSVLEVTHPPPAGGFSARPANGSGEMLITTANDLPGWEITETLGEVFGVTVRSRNIGSQFGASLKSLVGGELKGMTKALTDSRWQVIERMVEEAAAKGADAIVAMRFDTSEMGGVWTEICAYGTAVQARLSSGS